MLFSPFYILTVSPWLSCCPYHAARLDALLGVVVCSEEAGGEQISTSLMRAMKRFPNRHGLCRLHCNELTVICGDCCTATATTCTASYMSAASVCKPTEERIKWLNRRSNKHCQTTWIFTQLKHFINYLKTGNIIRLRFWYMHLSCCVKNHKYLMVFFVPGLVREAKKGIEASTMFHLGRKTSEHSCMFITFKKLQK